MKISAVVVNYHTASMLPGLCSSLRGQDGLCELVVVSNSPENIPFRVLEEKARLPVRIRRNKCNMGFGRAVNSALLGISSDYVLIVNPDARLLPGCVKALAEACARFDSPLAGPRFYWDNEKFFRLPPAVGDCLWMDFASQSATRFEMDAELLSFYWALRHDRFWSMQEPFFEPFLSGACLLISTDWIRKTRGKIFDEQFFLYYEDTDLCARALAWGHKPLCVPKAEAIHYWNQSPEPPQSKTKLMDKARVLFMDKHYGKSVQEYQTMAGKIGAKGSTTWKTLEQLDHPIDFQGLGHDYLGAYLEIGLSRHFVPFAQALTETAGQGLSGKLRELIPPGRYYVRIRHEDHGILKVWKWEK